MKYLFLLLFSVQAFARSPIIWKSSCPSKAFNLGDFSCALSVATGSFLPLTGGTVTGTTKFNTTSGGGIIIQDGVTSGATIIADPQNDKAALLATTAYYGNQFLSPQLQAGNAGTGLDFYGNFIGQNFQTGNSWNFIMNGMQQYIASFDGCSTGQASLCTNFNNNSTYSYNNTIDNGSGQSHWLNTMGFSGGVLLQWDDNPTIRTDNAGTLSLADGTGLSTLALTPGGLTLNADSSATFSSDAATAFVVGYSGVTIQPYTAANSDLTIKMRHIVTGTVGSAPTVTACGTTPSVTGDDKSGLITVGGGGTATSCQLNFNVAYANAPHCFVNDRTDSVSARVSTSGTANIVISHAAAFTAGALIDYWCVSN